MKAQILSNLFFLIGSVCLLLGTIINFYLSVKK